jgi:hypothetical protein
VIPKKWLQWLVSVMKLATRSEGQPLADTMHKSRRSPTSLHLVITLVVKAETTRILFNPEIEMGNLRELTSQGIDPGGGLILLTEAHRDAFRCANRMARKLRHLDVRVEDHPLGVSLSATLDKGSEIDAPRAEPKRKLTGFPDA